MWCYRTPLTILIQIGITKAIRLFLGDGGRIVPRRRSFTRSKPYYVNRGKLVDTIAALAVPSRYGIGYPRWWTEGGSNSPKSPQCKCGALPSMLSAQIYYSSVETNRQIKAKTIVTNIIKWMQSFRVSLNIAFARDMNPFSIIRLVPAIKLRRYFYHHSSVYRIFQFWASSIFPQVLCGIETLLGF